jgi:hypothetical protein
MIPPHLLARAVAGAAWYRGVSAEVRDALDRPEAWYGTRKASSPARPDPATLGARGTPDSLAWYERVWGPFDAATAGACLAAAVAAGNRPVAKVLLTTRGIDPAAALGDAALLRWWVGARGGVAGVDPTRLHAQYCAAGDTRTVRWLERLYEVQNVPFDRAAGRAAAHREGHRRLARWLDAMPPQMRTTSV